MNVLRTVLIVLIPGLSATCADAEIFLRWNQAGYRPDQPKSVVAMSDEDLAGETWRILDAESEPVVEGTFDASVVGMADHTPLPYNHVVNFTSLRKVGDFRFVVDGVEPALIRIAENTYESLLQLPLRHLRVMRSGSPHTLFRETSHLGDADTPMFVPDGDPADGEWKPSEDGSRVNALGGWYDAGDQIKFTLNNAYTTYHLLYAYNLQPALFTKIDSPTDLPDILDEAWHGLEFLMRTFPDENTFVVQVGDEEDHNQPRRLPEHDLLDGKRPAMCALSRTHMASTVAALALGSRTFASIDRPEIARSLREQAIRIHQRALSPGTIQTTFERGHVNDFYHDKTESDQMALAAFELYALTNEETYLEAAIAHAPPAASEVGWQDWNWLPNSLLAEHDPGARARLLAETKNYTAKANTTGIPWGIPGRYVWGSLPRWIGAANAARTTSLQAGPLPDHDALFFDMLDYTFGRNNWGVSFLFSEQLPNTVRHIYSPAYHLLNEFPTGALSEGPGNKDTHDSLRHYFDAALAGLDFVPDTSLDRFNTEVGVFSDSPVDFMTQEATITAQADILLMLTLALLETE